MTVCWRWRCNKNGIDFTRVDYFHGVSTDFGAVPRAKFLCVLNERIADPRQLGTFRVIDASGMNNANSAGTDETEPEGVC